MDLKYLKSLCECYYTDHLDIQQLYSNNQNDFINDINNTATWKTLYDLNNEVDSIYNKTIGDGGRSDVIYETLILNRGD